MWRTTRHSITFYLIAMASSNRRQTFSRQSHGRDVSAVRAIEIISAPAAAPISFPDAWAQRSVLSKALKCFDSFRPWRW